jgi:2-iminoacetate synthase
LNWDIDNIMKKTTSDEVLKILSKEKISEMDFLKLLSPAASLHLEEMAQIGSRISHRHFGSAITLYTPIYISNYCVNNCAYCGFSLKNKITRVKLSLAEIESEAVKISSKGLRHILLLTGESRSASSFEYICSAVKILRKYFSSIGIEIYPLDEFEYRTLVELGVDSLTVYQETYDMDLYEAVHISGPKKDFRYRLLAPERGGRSGMYGLNVGALLGLGDWRKDAFFTGVHAHYLLDQFPAVNLGVSMPRLRPEIGGFKPKTLVSDSDLVQFMLAIRLYIPRVILTVSTRESAKLRNNLIPLGINKMSAESNTGIGDIEDSSQFDISDTRSLEEIVSFLKSSGYQPVLKDWNIIKE